VDLQTNPSSALCLSLPQQKIPRGRQVAFGHSRKQRKSEKGLYCSIPLHESRTIKEKEEKSRTQSTNITGSCACFSVMTSENQGRLTLLSVTKIPMFPLHVFVRWRLQHAKEGVYVRTDPLPTILIAAMEPKYVNPVFKSTLLGGHTTEEIEVSSQSLPHMMT